MYKSNLSLTCNLMLSLWINWAIVILSYCTVLMSPLLIVKTWQPLLVAFVAYLLFRTSRKLSHSKNIPNCALIIRIAMLSLFWSSIIMGIINIMSSFEVLDSLFKWADNNIPYVTGLIIFPITVLVCIWYIVNRYNTSFCRSCQARNGLERGSGVITAIYNREARYQARLLLGLAAATTAIQWWYYWAYYINVNLNGPDQFFYIFLPVTLYALSLYIMKMHYNNLGAIIGPLSATYGKKEPSTRVIIISNEKILLANDKNGRLDTPKDLKFFSKKKISKKELQLKIQDLLNIDSIDLRYLYSNHSLGMRSQIDHYIIELPECKDAEIIEGEWYTLPQIDKLVRAARVATELVDEVFRIFTITMTWKTYNRDGSRKYPIKSYHPQFHLGEITKCELDFNDISWFGIADNNEDRSFFRLRRFWRRLTNQTPQ